MAKHLASVLIDTYNHDGHVEKLDQEITAGKTHRAQQVSTISRSLAVRARAPQRYVSRKAVETESRSGSMKNARIQAAPRGVMTEAPRVSVIIVNWNGAEHLRLCLPTLASQSFKPLEVIVVDNHSSDDSEEVARSFNARWIAVEANLGLAPGLNRGASIASGNLLLFVNNDMRFDPGFVSALIGPLLEDENIFATDGMQFNWDGTFRGHLAARLANVRTRGDSSTELVPGLYFHQQEHAEKTCVFMASAACMMVRRELFEKLGGFDDRLPLGYEDVEICWRAWTNGWKTVYVPNAICWHRISASVRSEEGARFNFRGILKGRLLLATKLLPAPYAFRTWLVSMAGLAKDLSRRRWTFASDRIGVLAQMAGLVPNLLHERKELFEKTKRSPAAQLDSLLQLSQPGEQQH